MPGLLRGIARTAVVAGTATAVSNRVSRRQAGRWAEQGPAEPGPAQPAPAVETPPPAPAPPAAPAAAPVDPVQARLDQLGTLGALRDQGVLTDAEFQEQKAQILAG